MDLSPSPLPAWEEWMSLSEEPAWRDGGLAGRQACLLLLFLGQTQT